MEQWKDIPGFEGCYQISDQGRVRSLDRKATSGKTLPGQIINPIVQKSGYHHVGLWRGGVCYQRRVHRLVAQAFIPNPENKPTVNHLNEDKGDNRVENLEWATHRENTVYGNCIEKRTANRNPNAPNRRMKVIGTDKEGREIVFDSITEALRYLGKNPKDGHISQCCKGKQKTAFGYAWRYGGDDK